jgi:hypothetical protein
MCAFRLGALAKALPLTVSRRRALSRLGAGIMVPPVAAASARGHLAAQDGITEVGRAPVGQHAFRLVGTIEQRGFDFSAYGFLMQVANLDPAQLFIDEDAFNRTAATARLTFRSTATATARAVHQPLFAVGATGMIEFFVNRDGGATFDEPESFGAGTVVASAALTVQNVVNVQQPQIGIVAGFADLLLEGSEPFALGESEYLFGGSGMAARMSLVGQGTLLDPELPEATMRFVGDAVTVA